LGVNPAEVVANTKLEQAKISNNETKVKFWQEQLENLKHDSESLKIEIAQINPIVGDLSNNAEKIIDFSCKAFESGVHLLVFPELTLCGYPPEDLLLREGFITQVETEIERIRKFLIVLIFLIYIYLNLTD
jgi:NAD+ synthase (glutamine-hydrolysing)